MRRISCPSLAVGRLAFHACSTSHQPSFCVSLLCFNCTNRDLVAYVCTCEHVESSGHTWLSSSSRQIISVSHLQCLNTDQSLLKGHRSILYLNGHVLSCLRYQANPIGLKILQSSLRDFHLVLLRFRSISNFLPFLGGLT